MSRTSSNSSVIIVSVVVIVVAEAVQRRGRARGLSRDGPHPLACDQAGCDESGEGKEPTPHGGSTTESCVQVRIDNCQQVSDRIARANDQGSLGRPPSGKQTNTHGSEASQGLRLGHDNEEHRSHPINTLGVASDAGRCARPIKVVGMGVEHANQDRLGDVSSKRGIAGKGARNILADVCGAAARAEADEGQVLVDIDGAATHAQQRLPYRRAVHIAYRQCRVLGSCRCGSGHSSRGFGVQREQLRLGQHASCYHDSQVRVRRQICAQDFPSLASRIPQSLS